MPPLPLDRDRDTKRFLHDKVGIIKRDTASHPVFAKDDRSQRSCAARIVTDILPYLKCFDLSDFRLFCFCPCFGSPRISFISLLTLCICNSCLMNPLSPSVDSKFLSLSTYCESMLTFFLFASCCDHVKGKVRPECRFSWVV